MIFQIYLVVALVLWVALMVINSVMGDRDDAYDIDTHVGIFIVAVAWPLILPVVSIYGMGCGVVWAIRTIAGR